MTRTSVARIAAAAVLFVAVLPTGPRTDARATAEAAVRVADLRTEYMREPLGLDTLAPRLSWKLVSDRRGVAQTAYQVRVAASSRDLASGRALVWDSGRVSSDGSVQNAYGGPALRSRQRYYWQVRIWDDRSAASAWSEPAWWEMGLLQPSDWTAQWIEPDAGDDPSKPSPAQMVRREFTANGRVARARVYVTSHGLYELHLNGQRVSEDLFTPGWTSYNKRLQYQVYDVTPLVKAGANAIGAVLGSGWYRGELAWSGHRNIYGSRLGLLAQLEITYENGRTQTIATDGHWKSSTGPIRASEIYLGETYDARLEQPGWSAPGFADARWSPVQTADSSPSHIVASIGPPVRRSEELTPVRVFTTPAGDLVADMGQNMVGWVRLAVEGPAGTTVTLRHAEVLDAAGNFYTENLRGAKATDQYTLKGGGPEVFEPHFTFHGFRYVALSGYPGQLTPGKLKGIVIHSQMESTGEFETSKPLTNQLQHNIRWGQRGNFLDVPTDCPQRDERLGWTGDAQVFSRTAAFNMDVAAFFSKWLKDVALDQYPSGSVPHVIPDVLSTVERREAGGSAGWGDVAVIVPWTMYLTYGDRRLLEEQYPSMTRWVEFERTRAGADDVWDGDEHFGDWLAFATNRSDYPGATTGKDLIATAFFAHSTDLVARAARVLGKADDAAKYETLVDRVKAAFVREFVTPAGRVGENTQTAYALALQFDLLPEPLRPIAAARLARDIRERGHLTTGFLGTPYLCHVLSRYGYLDEAYLLLNREEYPSWLYPVKQGATTIWERWDGRKPDGSFQDKGMNSFNHYAYGAIGDWMYEVMAGIDVDAARPGYKHVVIAPQPGGGFRSVTASHESMYGRVASAWTLQGNRFALTVTVPANTRGTIRLPRARLAGVSADGQPLAPGNGIAAATQAGETVEAELGSGTYRFEYEMTTPPSGAAATGTSR